MSDAIEKGRVQAKRALKGEEELIPGAMMLRARQKPQKEECRGFPGGSGRTWF